MRVDHFDFDLPEDRIALRPVSPRDSARLLSVSGKQLADYTVRDLPGLLRSGDVLVFNDTKVIPVQLAGKRERDGNIATVSATLHTRLGDNRWAAFVKGAKKLSPGDRINFNPDSSVCEVCNLSCTVSKKTEGGNVELDFDLSGEPLTEAIVGAGTMPLPPYIASKRRSDSQDNNDYQTVYAAREGAVAAPTAGLHFTPELLDSISKMGVDFAFVTLHVGPGTFLPVKVEETTEHKMHSEWGEISKRAADMINAAKEKGGRVICIGTTSLRLLESAADEQGRIRPWAGDTAIFVTPGYQFRIADMLMTNFHLPRSTLFMLVSAFSGLEVMKRAYDHAISSGYRFYSYGDSSLLVRAT